MEERILQSRRLYKGRVVTLDIHDVELPDGKHSVREVVQHPGAVAIVAADGDGQILLVRQYRIAADQIMLEIPAGTLHPGEDPLECAERELQEETGYKPGRLDLLGGIYAAPGYTSEFIFLYAASELERSSLPMDDDEFIEVVRLPLVEAIARIESGEINDSKTVAGLMRVARRMGV